MTLFWLVLRQVNVNAVLGQVIDMDWRTLFVAVLMLVGLSVFAAIRWSVVLHAIGHPLRFWVIWQIVLVGIFFNQSLPSTFGGDLMRMSHSYHAGLPRVVAVGSVVMDRAIAFVALVLIVVVSLPVGLDYIDHLAFRWVLLLTVVFGILGLLALVSLDRILTSAGRWHFGSCLLRYSAELRRVLLSVHWAPRVILPAVAVHGI